MSKDRPIGITLSAILGFLFVVLSVLRSAELLFRGAFATLVGREDYGLYAAILGFLLMGLAAVVLILVYGLWVGEHWAWSLGIIVGVVDLLSNLVNLAFVPWRSAIGVVLSLLFLYVLTRPRVKAYLHVGSPPPSDVQPQAPG